MSLDTHVIVTLKVAITTYYNHKNNCTLIVRCDNDIGSTNQLIISMSVVNIILEKPDVHNTITAPGLPPGRHVSPGT